MTKKNSSAKVSKIFWRVVISSIGMLLIIITLGSLSLFFLGKSTSVEVTTRRTGGADEGWLASQRYSWSVHYTFKVESGKAFSGYATRRGSDVSVGVNGRAYYFPFAPFINALESEVKPNIGQPLLVIIGIFLVFSVNRKRKTNTKGGDFLKDLLLEITVPIVKNRQILKQLCIEIGILFGLIILIILFTQAYSGILLILLSLTVAEVWPFCFQGYL